MALGLAITPHGGLAQPTQLADGWTSAQSGEITYYVCTVPACASHTTVAVADSVTRPLPISRALLDDGQLAARMAEGIARGIGASDVLDPFKRADIGQHVGFLGIVRAPADGSMAVFISFEGRVSRAFMATAGTRQEAIEALVVIAAKVPAP